MEIKPSKMLPKGLSATTCKAPCCPVAWPPVPNAAPAASRPMSEYTAPSVAYPHRASHSIHGRARWAASLVWNLASSERFFLELILSSHAGPRECHPIARYTNSAMGASEPCDHGSLALILA